MRQNVFRFTINDIEMIGDQFYSVRSIPIYGFYVIGVMDIFISMDWCRYLLEIR